VVRWIGPIQAENRVTFPRAQILLLLLCWPFIAFAQPKPDYAPDAVLVRFEKNTSLDEARKALNSGAFEVEETLVPSLNIFLVRLPDQLTVPEALSTLRNYPGVLWVQADHFLDLRSTIPDDYQFTTQWALDQASGADIDATSAWDISTGGTSPGGDDIVVAVVDNGCLLSQLDLEPNLWVNAGEISGNGWDDDGNGYVDDVNGWDAFADNGSIPVPGSPYHGTHVAGIVGARGNNAAQVSGVNWRVKLMIVAGADTRTSIVSRAYNYVLTQKNHWLQSGGASGANVVATNSSFGKDAADCASDSFPLWNDLYNAMGAAGILSACATANAGWDVDVVGDVPTACASPYIVSVTNTTSLDERYANAAWGDTTIDLGAPGTSIRSTINTGTGLLTGTSMATPHVAGTVGLLHAAASHDFYRYYVEHPDSAALALKQMILDNVDLLPGFDTLTVSGGRLNLFRAVQAARDFVAPAPTDPFLAFAGCVVEDAGSGDGDGVFEPGETVRITVTVANYGADAANVTGVLSTGDAFVTLVDNYGTWGDIPAGTQGENSANRFEVTADAGTPFGHSASFALICVAGGPDTSVLHFNLPVGERSLYWSDSVESGENGWTHAAVLPGFSDQWHISTETFASAGHAWKCGDTGTGTHANRLDAGLVSPAITAWPHTSLSLSHWLDSETNGADSAYDGAVVEISVADGPFVELTPLDGYGRHFKHVRGTSFYTGPLPGSACFAGSNAWQRRSFDLSAYAGQSVRIRFRFGSDSTVTREGWYLDDVELRGEVPQRGAVPAVDDLVIELYGESDIRLGWSHPEPGIDYYVVYRNSDALFVPAVSDSIGWTSDTTYVDSGAVLLAPRSFYCVKAVAH
jgi:hypothetical protein